MKAKVWMQSIQEKDKDAENKKLMDDKILREVSVMVIGDSRKPWGMHFTYFLL